MVGGQQRPIRLMHRRSPGTAGTATVLVSLSRVDCGMGAATAAWELGMGGANKSTFDQLPHL